MHFLKGIVRWILTLRCLKRYYKGIYHFICESYRIQTLLLLKTQIRIGKWYLFSVHYVVDRSCEQDWEYYDGSCYFHEGNIKTFSAAQANCELKQANLVTVNNINEHKFLSVLMGRYGAWNGLNSLNDTEVFEWISGEKGNFTNWLPGQPNKRYHCIHMLQKGEHKWRTKACSSTLRSICEKKGRLGLNKRE